MPVLSQDQGGWTQTFKTNIDHLNYAWDQFKYRVNTYAPGTYSLQQSAQAKVPAPSVIRQRIK